MKPSFYVVRLSFYPERPIGVSHFGHHSTVRFRDLTNALKYALNDRITRGGAETVSTNARYGGCQIRRGMSAETGTAVARIYYDGEIEYYSAKAQRIAEELMN